MKCSDIQELIGMYFDLPENDLRRRYIDEHKLRCSACRAEFRIWKESMEWIRLAKDEPGKSLPSSTIASHVMNRIYGEEMWRLPLQNRIRFLPIKLRRNLTAVISFCFILFVFSFFFALFGESYGQNEELDYTQYGFNQTVRASSNTSDNPLHIHTPSQMVLSGAGSMMIKSVKIGMMQTFPDTLLVLSILGMIAALLIVKWLSRTK